MEFKLIPSGTGAQAPGQIKMKKVRSKHNSLLNYFIHDDRDLSPAYIRNCEKFLDGLRKKGYRLQARKRSSVFPKGKINWFKKKMDRDRA